MKILGVGAYEREVLINQLSSSIQLKRDDPGSERTEAGGAMKGKFLPRLHDFYDSSRMTRSHC